ARGAAGRVPCGAVRPVPRRARTAGERRGVAAGIPARLRRLRCDAPSDRGSEDPTAVPEKGIGEPTRPVRDPVQRAAATTPTTPATEASLGVVEASAHAR